MGAKGYQNARCYWEMYQGVTVADDSLHQRVFAFDIWLDIGGSKAADYPDSYQVSVYGRETVNGDNLVTFYRHNIDGTNRWRRVRVSKFVSHADCRTVVLRVEAKSETSAGASVPAGTRTYDDQCSTADPPPWGIRIHKFAVYGSPLKRDVRVHRVLNHILEGGGFDYSGPAVTDWEPDQLAFTEIPKDRLDAVDEVNGLLGWYYGCWNGHTVEFAKPKTGTLREVASDDPRTTWSIEQNLDETYNAVRVKFTNARGKLREVILQAEDSPLSITRADTLDAPESIKSLKAARRFGNRYLAAHKDLQTYGTLTITGYDPAVDSFDPLLVRPGDRLRMTGPARMLRGTHDITAVALNPLDWSASLQFGTNSRRFDIWLARLAVGAKSIKRR